MHRCFVPFFVVAAMAPFFVSCAGGPGVAQPTSAQEHGSLTDPRDGQQYRAVKIGERRWMAQNLAFKSSSSWCYENSQAKCETYGRLYAPLAAIHACPAGWHVANGADWSDLLARAGTTTGATKLISAHGWVFQGRWWDRFNPMRWIRPLGASDQQAVAWIATDSLGMRVLPGGYRSSGEGAGKQAFVQVKVPWGSEKAEGKFSDVGQRAHFWASSRFDESLEWNGDPATGISIVSDAPMFENHAFSVRCVENAPRLY